MVVAPGVLAWRTMSLFGWPKWIFAWAFVPNRSSSGVVGVTAAVSVCPTSGPEPTPLSFKIPRSLAVVPPLTSWTERLSPLG